MLLNSNHAFLHLETGKTVRTSLTQTSSWLHGRARKQAFMPIQMSQNVNPNLLASHLWIQQHIHLILENRLQGLHCMEEGLRTIHITARLRHDDKQILSGSNGATLAHQEDHTEMLLDLLHQCSQTVRQGQSTGQLERRLHKGGQMRMASVFLDGEERGGVTKATT
jgi:hypothetical protein